MKILVTGGLGYIGSHTVVALIEQKYEVVIVDNLYNSKLETLDKIEMITSVKPQFYQIDLLDQAKLEAIFQKHNFDAIIHFAGYKAVGESCKKPLEYYENNVSASINLYLLAQKYHCHNIVFSSSATVYGDQFKVPFKEEYGLGIATNPYGESKIMNERILSDACSANNELSVVLLRYFNPVGAHKSGLIGENPNGIPNNLMPYISKVAINELSHINVFGDDYDTHDGTGVRDYIHVLDLAKGHILALEYAIKNKGCEVINLGRGSGYSVLDMIKAYSKACGFPLKYQIVPRRAGDIATSYADTEKAYKLLGFKAEYNLDDMCLDSYNYILKNR